MTRQRSWFDDKNITPIQIREDHWVRIANLPHDLTEAEARKIADIVIAHVLPSLTPAR